MRSEEIGKTIRRARVDKGYRSRASLVDSCLRGVITQEGLRKIEMGERIPMLGNLHKIADALDIEAPVVKEMEEAALQKNISRAARRSGSPKAFKVEGSSVRYLPPRKELEKLVREIVTDLVELVDRYGVMKEDLDHFRMHARDELLKRLI